MVFPLAEKEGFSSECSVLISFSFCILFHFPLGDFVKRNKSLFLELSLFEKAATILFPSALMSPPPKMPSLWGVNALRPMLSGAPQVLPCFLHIDIPRLLQKFPFLLKTPLINSEPSLSMLNTEL